MKHNFNYRQCLSILLMIVLIIATMPVGVFPKTFAADTGLSANLKYISTADLPSNITLTNTNANFSPNNTYPMLVKGGVTTALSIVTQSTGTITATLPNTLTNGTYEIRIGDPNGPVHGSAKYFIAGDLIVANPTITSVSPMPNLPLGYSNLTEITVRGQYANWTTGQTSVEILNASNAVVQTPSVKSITTVDAYNKDLVFSLGTGLSQGNYKIRVTSGTQIITTTNAITVRGQASVAYSGYQTLSLNEGYSAQTITLNGTNTSFVSGTTTVTVVDASNTNTGNASSLNIINGTSLSFLLATGLTSGTYTIKVKTDVEEASIDFSVNAASASLFDATGNNLVASVNRQGSGVSFKVTGSNTSFASGVSNIELLNNTTVVPGAVTTTTINSTTAIDTTVNVNQTPGTAYKLRITTNSQVVTTQAFEIKAPATPTVTYNSIVYSNGNLSEGYPSFQVTVKGNSFTNFTVASTATLDSQTPAITLVDGTEINFIMPVGLTQGAKTLSIDIDGSPSTTFDKFDYALTITKPAISSISPNSLINTLTTAQTIIIQGTNTHFDLQGATINVQILDANQVPVGSVSNFNASSSQLLSFDVIPNSITSTGNYTVNAVVTKGSYTENIKLTNGLTVSASGIGSVTPASLYHDALASQTLQIVGINTSFDTNDTYQIDSVGVPSKTVTDATHVTLSVPSSLSVGSHTIRIIDGANTYTSSFLVTADRTISVNNFTTPKDYTNETITATAENINFLASAANVPNVTVNGQSVVVSTTGNGNTITFPVPIGLGKGTYTVTFTWTSGVHAGLSLSDTITVTNRYSSVYVKKNNVAATTLSLNAGTTEQLALFGTRISGGTDENITSKATYALTAGSGIITISSSGLITAIQKGSASFTATYDEKTTTVTVTVNRSLSNVYFKVAGGDVSTLNKYSDDAAVTLQVYGTSATNGESIDVTNDATLAIISGSDVVSLNGMALSFLKVGTATVRATAEGVSSDLGITITARPSTSNGSSNDSSTSNYVAALPGTTLPVVTMPVEIGDVEVKNLAEGKVLPTGGNLSFETIGIQIQIPANTFKNAANITVATIKQLTINGIPSIMLNKKDVVKLIEKTDLSTLTTVGEVFNFDSDVILEKPVDVTFKFDKTKVTNFDLLGVYYYNRSSGAWDYVGGKVDPATGSIRAQLKHFSLYSVMTYEKTFEDIKTHWAKAAIENMASVHIAVGLDNKFMPDRTITRAEFTTLLVKTLNLDFPKENSQFKDVTAKDWYSDYITAAVKAKIVTGYGNQFKPNANITREEMAVMIANAYAYKLGSQPPSTSTVFKDAKSISSWAVSDVAFVNAKKIINGYPDNQFKPKNKATRAEAIVMLKALRTLIM